MPEVISRKEARALGLERYFTGKPCLHGHLSERKCESKTCLACVECKRRLSAIGMQRVRSNALRLEAMERGLHQYFTGVPCRNGHIAGRYVFNSSCMECRVVSARNTRLRHRESLSKKSRARYYKNKPAIRKQVRERKRRMAAALTALEELGIDI